MTSHLTLITITILKKLRLYKFLFEEKECNIPPGRKIGSFLDDTIPFLWKKRMEHGEKTAKNILPYLSDPKIHSILDIGTGRGYVWLCLEKNTTRKIKIIGIDPYKRPSKKTMDILKKIRTKKNLEPPKFICSTAQKLPFKKSTFDSAIFTYTLHHMPFTKQQKAIKEAIRVTKKNRVIIISEDTPKKGNPREIELYEKTDMLLNFEDRTQPHNYRTIDDWQKVFESLGLKIYKAKSFNTRQQTKELQHTVWYLVNKK